MANTEATLGPKPKKKRQKRIKKLGQKIIRGLGDFIGRQSQVGDVPIHDTKDFPALAPFVESL